MAEVQNLREKLSVSTSLSQNLWVVTDGGGWKLKGISRPIE